jgi:hypothetical protein
MAEVKARVPEAVGSVNVTAAPGPPVCTVVLWVAPQTKLPVVEISSPAVNGLTTVPALDQYWVINWLVKATVPLLVGNVSVVDAPSTPLWIVVVNASPEEAQM